MGKKDLLMVLARQAGPEDAGILGTLSLDESDGYHGVPTYIAVDRELFKKHREERAEVADEIVRLMHEHNIGPEVYVGIHKKDPRFVYAMLGLADELLKRHRERIHLITFGDQRNEIDAEIRRCMAEQADEKAACPLVKTFDEIEFGPFEEILRTEFYGS